MRRRRRAPAERSREPRAQPRKRRSSLPRENTASIHASAAPRRRRTSASCRWSRPGNSAVALKDPTMCSVAKMKPPRSQRVFSGNSAKPASFACEVTAIGNAPRLVAGSSKKISRNVARRSSGSYPPASSAWQSAHSLSPGVYTTGTFTPSSRPRRSRIISSEQGVPRMSPMWIRKSTALASASASSRRARGSSQG